MSSFYQFSAKPSIVLLQNCLSTLGSHWCPVFINFREAFYRVTPKLFVDAGISLVSSFYQFSQSLLSCYSKIACRRWDLTGVQIKCIAILSFNNIFLIMSQHAKGLTKTQMISEIATKTGLTRKQVKDVFTATTGIIESEIKSHKHVTLFDLIKIVVKTKKATSERPGINPFTGEATTFKAHPSKEVIKAKALKRLKDMI